MMPPELPQASPARRSPLPFTGVGMRKRAAFYTQLARLLQAGIGIARCLDTLAGQGGSWRLARAAGAMAAHVRAGGRLSQAFAQHPNIFPINEVRVLEGAEHAGREPEAMLHIARLLDHLALARARVVCGLIYPGLCLAIAFFGLPLGIAYAMGGPDAALKVFLGQLKLFGTVAGAWLALVVLFRSIPQGSSLRVGLHALALGLPLFGKTFRRLALARFADTFQSLYAAGVMSPEAMARAAWACGNDFMASRILRVAPLVASGTPVWSALARSGVMPPLAVDILSVGEAAGKLEDALARFAEYQHQDLEIGIERLARILPTLALFLMIVILGYMVLRAWGAYISGAMNFLNH